MAQNTSHAVMAQRAEPHDSLDFFPTPPWATRALCEILSKNWDLAQQRAWEPACGQGHMARPMAEYFGTVFSSDVHDYGAGQVLDFLWHYDGPKFDWIITNPPFRLAEQFILTALTRADRGVAVLVRTSFLESVGRYHRLFSTHKPSVVMQFSERVPMHKGRLVEDGSTATAYCWIVWMVRNDEARGPTQFVWVPPCRDVLERGGDYAEAAE